MNLLDDTLRIWAMHREFRAVLADLKGRSDRELSELGLTRGDIARTAYAEAERRILAPVAASGTSRPETSADIWPGPALAAGRYR